MMEEVGEMSLVVRQVWRICLIMFVMGRFTSLRMRRVGILCEFHAFSGLAALTSSQQGIRLFRWSANGIGGSV